MPGPGRRRALTILAGIPALALAGLPRPSAGRPTLHRWTGTALGTEASIALYHGDGGAARAIIADCVAELQRLEAVLTLYDPGSALAVLNRDGVLDSPPPELVELLAVSIGWGDRSGGAFDVTVQPLWRLYASHFATPGADPAGPAAESVEAARRLVDYRAVAVSPNRIAFRPGMAVTLNGIAQGYVTDRVAELLARRGIGHVLLDLGETRALDGHPDGRLWRLGIPDPQAPERLVTTFDLAKGAAATSGGYGLRFDAEGRFHHILDPASGRSPLGWSSVTVTAADATTADVLSTALTVLPQAAAPALLAGAGADAVLIAPDGAISRQ